MRTRKAVAATALVAGLLAALAPGAAASSSSCVAQFVGAFTGPDAAGPFGTTIVVPEIQALPAGSHLGSDVSAGARADRTNCPTG